MRINKIVLAITVFGFAASSALAMENLEKLTTNNPRTDIFLQEGTSLRYVDSAYCLINNPFFKLPLTLQKYRFFGTRFKIEQDLAEKNFVPCNFSNGKRAIICGTTDEKKCNC